jgi:membrane protein DedA with SNARE-associated domain
MFESYILSVISNYLYLGTFFLMFLETIFPPIPSEIVMPFSGYMANYLGFSQLESILLILCGNFGTTLGAVLIYHLSFKFGRKFLLKYGKYFLIERKVVQNSEKWFKKYGAMAVFLCRLIPGVRSLVSIPAGVTKMDFRKFFVLTFFGSIIWTSFLFYTGFLLKEFFNITKVTDLITILILIMVLIYLLAKFRR